MSAAPRVLALLTDAYGAGGGIAQYNRDWLAAAAAAGAQIEVFAFGHCQPQGSAIPNGVTLRVATRSRLRIAVRVLHAAWSGRAQLVWCGHLHLVPLAAVAARVAGARLWLQVHGIDAWERPSWLRRLGSARAQLVTAVSRHTRRKVLAWLGGEPSRIRVLPNTVAEGFTPGARDAVLAAQLGVDGGPILLTVGRLAASEAYKGHDRIIACLPALLRQFPRLQYVVVGEGGDRERLAALAARGGVAAQVRLVGALAGDQLAAAYRLADAFVMPSTGEGFGIAYLEAMACGVPALGLDVDGSADPLADGALGECVSDGELPAGLLRVLDPDRPRGTLLAERLRQRFGRARFEAQLRRLLESASARQA